MFIKKRKFHGVYEIILNPISDSRGLFMRTLDKKIFKKNSIPTNWVQENLSLTKKMGTIRGLHIQSSLFCEAKLIQVVKGSIFDVFVDLRKESKTFCQFDCIILTENNYKSILLPKGIAHGFCTLTDDCIVLYKMDNYYNPLHSKGIIWNDQSLKINWPVDSPIISEKDQNLPSLEEYLKKYKLSKMYK